MREQLWQYAILLYEEVPSVVYIGLFLILCFGIVIIFCIRGFRKGWKLAGFLMLAEYALLLLCSTVFFRPVHEVRAYNFHPFWSYCVPGLFVENVMNVVVFVPVGLLIGTQISRNSQIKGWLVAIAVGAGLSFGIETLQFMFKKGFSEVDDVMHNTMGCLIGYMMVKGSMVMFNGFGHRRIEE